MFNVSYEPEHWTFLRRFGGICGTGPIDRDLILMILC